MPQSRTYFHFLISSVLLSMGVLCIVRRTCIVKRTKPRPTFFEAKYV